MAVFAVLVVGSVDFADAQSFQSSPTITGIGGTTVNVNIRVTPSDTTATSVEFNPFAVSDFNAAGGTVSLANRESPITVAFGLPSVTETTVFDDFFIQLHYTTNNGNPSNVFIRVAATVNPDPTATPSGPTFQSVTVNGTSGTTVNANLGVTPTDFTINSVVGSNGTQFNTAGGTVSATNLSDPITLAFVLPIVNATTTLTETLRVAYTGDGGVETDMVNATITVNPAPPTPPTISDITATGTAGTSISHTLQVTDVPDGYTFDSATPDSTLSTANVTASGTESNGTVTISFGLPSVGSSTEITGNLNVQYTDGTDTLDVTVPVTLTVNPPDPPTVTNITTTGTENTTINETITVTNVPTGYTYTSTAADSTLTAAGVSISGTESGGTISVDIGLPSAQATAITGNIVVTYGDGTNTLISNSAVSLTVNPPDPPTISDITATGTGGTSETHTLQVSGIPSGYSFLSATPASNLSDDNVTASGTDSGGTVTISFGLPPVSATATITGDLSVRYSNGTTNLDVTVPVSLTVNPPAPPTVTNITATGTENTTISETITVTNVPVGYSFTNATADATLTAAGVSISGTESNRTITVSIGLPSAQATAITGNIVVSYGGLISNSAVSLTVNPPDPPTISDITATGTAGTSISHTLQVTDVPDGYTFDSATPDSTLSTANVTASGAESGGTVTISFGLPSVGSSTEITGNLNVQYTDGTDTLDVAVPVTLTVNPPDPPTVTNITATGTENTTINETITVTNVPIGYSFTNATADATLTAAGVSISGTESGGTISVDIGLPSAQATAITGNIVVTYGDGTNTLISNSAVSLTVNPPDPPTISDITATGTGGTSETHTLQVSGIPSGYSFLSATPASNLSSDNVTASGTDSGGTVTISFGLPPVSATATITGDLSVRYSNGTTNLDVTVPVSLTVNPPAPPTVTNITATGTENTTISETITVTNVPAGYSFTNATADATLTAAGVTISGTESNGTITVSIGLPSAQATAITGNIVVSYGGLISNSAVSLTVNPPDPPIISDITATGTGGTSISHTLQVSDVPDGYSFDSAAPDSDLTDESVTASGEESGGTVTITFGLPSVGSSTEITGNLNVQYTDGTDTLDVAVPVTLTVNPPDPPTVTNITATGIENTTISETITVTNVPAGYSFLSATPDSTLSTANVTASGTESNGTISVDIGLPSAQATAITGNIIVSYGDGTNTLISNSAVSLTVNAAVVDPPTIQDIAVTGTGGTSETHILQVTDIPDGYTFDSATPDSDLTDESVTASGTESSGTVTISFGLPSVGTSTTITGNLDVTYTDGTDDLDVVVPVTLTVNPVPSPAFQNITVNGTGGTTVNANLGVTPTDFTITSVFGNRESTFTTAGGSVSATSLSNPITLAFVLPTVNATTTLTDTLQISYQLNGVGFAPTVSATITVNPDSTIPTPPTIQNIAVTGTGGTSETHTLQVSNVPDGYSFLSAAPASNLSDDNVTASGTDSSGTVTISFGLPSVGSSTTITGDLSVRYSNGTTNLDVTVPVTLTVNPPDPPTVTNITATGTENTTISETITVTNVPVGYSFTNATADATLTSAGVTISGTESGGTISVDIGLPSAQASTITGNILVSYGDGSTTLTSNSAVSLTVNPPDPPTVTNITATGTENTTITDTITVTNIPTGYTFTSVARDSALTSAGVTISGTESNGTISVDIGLPSAQATPITGNIVVTYGDGTNTLTSDSAVSLTVEPVIIDPPIISDITATGTGGTSISHTLQISNIPAGYTFDSAAPDSDLTDESVTASGTESSGTVTISFGLPSVGTSTTITGNLDVTYTDGTDDLDVTVPVTLTVNPVPSPVFQNITLNGTSGATVNANIPVTPTDFTVTSVSGSSQTTFTLAGGSVSATNLGDPITLAFVLPTVTQTTELRDTLLISYQLNGQGSVRTVSATITVNPDSTIPIPPTIQNIAVTGTAGTSISHTLQVSNVPDGYSFLSATPASNLSDDNVTASGTDSSGTVTISFGLPSVGSSTTITGDLSVRYSNGTTNLDVTVPVTLTVNPPDPPTVTNITATGTENTTISETITVTNVPTGYTYTSIAADSTLTSAGVTISGTESNGTISVDIGLPSAQATPITGNIIVSYGGLTSNSTVSLTVNAAPTTPPTTPPSTVTPPTIQNITVTGTGGTSISHTLQVSNVPSGYSFLSVTPNSPIINVSGTESGGTVTLSFVLPTVNNSHTLTGNLNIRYSNGTDNLDVIVPVSLTINLPDPPTVTNITATGTENTTITETITVSNVPSGYIYTSIAADSTLTAAGVSISGTESGGTITVSIGLPSAQTITGNIIVSYGDGSTTLTSNSAVSLTVETVDPPTISNITATGTGGTSISHTLQVSDIPSGYSFVSAAPASNLSDDNVTASGTDSGGTVTISFGLPEVRTSTTITGNLDVRYSDGTDNLDVTVPVTLTVNPVPLPVFQDIAVTGTSGSTVNANIPVTPSDFTVTSVSGTRSSTFTTAGGSVSATSLSNPITLAFVLPTVTQTTELTETLNISYRLNGAGFAPTVTATITVNPVTLDLPTIQDITATGTGGTSIPYNLQVTNVPSGYNFVSTTPDSTLSTASVTASGAESNGAVTVTFGLPTVNSSTEITGNLNVRYSDGTTNLDVTVPVSLTVNPPAPPTVTNITATGIADTTITETITVTNVPAGYTYTSIAADSTLTTAGVSISGTESNGTITVSIDLPSTQASITGNIIVTYGDGTNTLTSNSAVSLTVNPVPTVPPTTPPTVPPTTPPTTPPTIQDITVTGTSGTSISHNLQVSNIPSDYSFVSIQPATNFEDVTIAGTESNGVIIITFDLPDVDEFTIITGDLLVRYLDGMEDSQQFTVPVTIQIDPERSGGSSDDHKKAPTFGVSLETDTQLVTGGFSFNGIILDITDNWHTDFNRTSSIIGDTNTVTIKGHAPDGFRQVILSLGVPEVGMVNNADTAIILNLQRNSETGLEISEILYSQSEEGLVDETRTTATVQKASCSLLDNNQQCYEFTIEFTVMAPLLDDVLTISAMDEKRRITHTYINDGVEFAGDSLLEASTDRFIQKVASQDPGSFIELTQQDRRYNVWEDQDGYLWERNSADTWMRLTYPGLELMPDDPSMSIKTRLHSDFARIIQMEQDRATLVFDSALIQNEMDDSSIYNLPAYMPEHLDPVLLENMELEEILELEKMLNRHIYEDSWD